MFIIYFGRNSCQFGWLLIVYDIAYSMTYPIFLYCARFHLELSLEKLLLSEVFLLNEFDKSGSPLSICGNCVMCFCVHRLG